METTERPLTVRERAAEAANLHPSCTLEYRRLKRQKLYQAIFKSKPGSAPFLYKAQGKTLDEALQRATDQFIGVARRAAAAKKAADDAAAEAAELELADEVSSGEGEVEVTDAGAE